MEQLSEVWVHRKSGGLYVILIESAWQEKDLAEVVVYKSLKDGKIWTRPFIEFHDRFYRMRADLVKVE